MVNQLGEAKNGDGWLILDEVYCDLKCSAFC